MTRSADPSRAPRPHNPTAAEDPCDSIIRRALTEHHVMALQAVTAEDLQLSPCATRLAAKLWWRTALDIAVAPASIVLRQDDCGHKTVTELCKAVLTVLKTHSLQHSGDGPIAGRPLAHNEAQLLRATSVDDLGLSVRATNLLKRVRWRTALDIATARVADAMSQRNCGRRTVLELRNAVLTVIETLGEVEPRTSIPPSTTPETSIGPAIAGRQLTDEEVETLRTMPLEELGLTVRAKHVIERAGWSTPLDIALAPAYAALAEKNCGRKTFAELQKAISRVLEERASEDPEISLEPDRIRFFVDDMTASLGDRAAFVVRERYGLWDGTRETLDDIGHALGVTRERVRQIQEKSLRLFREGPWRRPSLNLLNRLRETILSSVISSIELGVIRRDQLESYLAPHLDASEGHEQKSRLLTFRFLCEVFLLDPILETGDLLTFSDGLFFVSREAEDRFRMIEAAARTFLTSRGRPVSLNEAVRALPAYGAQATEAELDRCGDVSGVIGVDSSNSIGLRRWRFFKRRNLAALIHRALIEFGQPTHFSHIADRVNAIAPDRRHRTGQALASAMILHPEVFVGLGRGIYGLRDWGISRPPFIRDFLAQEIRNRGGRASVRDLATLGSQRYGFKATSISMTLSMNPQLFRDLGKGLYSLA